MDWIELLTQIFELCIVPLLAVLTKFVVDAITTYKNNKLISAANETEKKYITMLSDTITDCVIATNQTYVDSLKGKDAFTAEAQKEAFNRTYKAVTTILSEDAVQYLTSVFGDLESVIKEKIEAAVYKNNKKKEEE